MYFMLMILTKCQNDENIDDIMSFIYLPTLTSILKNIMTNNHINL